MPKVPTPLTELQVRRAKPKESTYSLGDGDGLFLRVEPSGRKLWISRKHPLTGARTNRKLGEWPELSLAKARAMMLSVQEDARRTAGSKAFRDAATLWFEERQASWAKSTANKASLVVFTYLVPDLGDMLVADIRTQHVVKPLRTLARRAPTLADKAIGYLTGILDFSALMGWRSEDLAIKTRGLLLPYKAGHMPAVTRERKVGEFIARIWSYRRPVTRGALQLLVWTAMRPGVVASARWDEMDLKRAEWHVSGLNEDGSNRMKMGQDHIVSLPTQALTMLEEMADLRGRSSFVFPGPGRQQQTHLHRDTMSKALRTLGLQGVQTPHGFRATLRTLARERLEIAPDILEAQLAHAKRGQVQAAYDRTTFDQARRIAMQEWADYLDGLRADFEHSLTE